MNLLKAWSLVCAWLLVYTGTIANAADGPGTQLPNPAKDGWNSEALSDAAGGQLKHLKQLLQRPAHLSEEYVAALATDDFACSALRPSDLEVVWRDKDLAVSRGQRFGLRGESVGPKRLAQALRHLLSPLSPGRLVRL